MIFASSRINLSPKTVSREERRRDAARGKKSTIISKVMCEVNVPMLENEDEQCRSGGCHVKTSNAFLRSESLRTECHDSVSKND